MTMDENAISALAYALWDAEHTTRLPPDEFENYAKKARDLFYVIEKYREKKDKENIANQILNQNKPQ